MSTLFRVLAVLSVAVGVGGALYGPWCVYRARRYARADVPRWKLWSSSAATNYEYYEEPGHVWIERATLAQALIPLGFFAALAFYVIAGTL